MFKQKKFTSTSGKEYLFQHPGVRAATQISDRCKDKHGMVSEYRAGEEMMKHVVVEPKLTWEHFEDQKVEFNEVIGAALLFLEGQDEDSKKI